MPPISRRFRLLLAYLVVFLNIQGICYRSNMRQFLYVARSNTGYIKELKEILLHYPPFKKDVSKIIKEIKDGKRENAGEAVQGLLSKYSLHERWFSYLYDYIEFGKKDDGFDPEAIKIEYGGNEYTGTDEEETIIMHLTPDSKPDDVLRAYKDAITFFNCKTRQRNKRWPSYKRDLRILELKSKGWSDDDVAKKCRIPIDQISPNIILTKKKLKERFKNKKRIQVISRTNPHMF